MNEIIIINVGYGIAIFLILVLIHQNRERISKYLGKIEYFAKNLFPKPDNISKAHEGLPSKRYYKVFIFRFAAGNSQDPAIRLTQYLNKVLEHSSLAPVIQFSYVDIELPQVNDVRSVDRIVKTYMHRKGCDLGIWGNIDKKSKQFKIRFVSANGSNPQLNLVYQHSSKYSLNIQPSWIMVESLLSIIAHLATLSSHNGLEKPLQYQILKDIRDKLHFETQAKLQSATEKQDFHDVNRLRHDNAFCSLTSFLIWQKSEDIDTAINGYRELLNTNEPSQDFNQRTAIRHGLGEALYERGQLNADQNDLQASSVALTSAMTMLQQDREIDSWLGCASKLGKTLMALGKATKNESILIKSEQLLRNLDAENKYFVDPERHFDLASDILAASAMRMDKSDHETLEDITEKLEYIENYPPNLIAPRRKFENYNAIASNLINIGKEVNDVEYINHGVDIHKKNMSVLPYSSRILRNQIRSNISQAIAYILEVSDQIEVYNTQSDSDFITRKAKTETLNWDRSMNSEKYIDIFQEKEGFFSPKPNHQVDRFAPSRDFANDSFDFDVPRPANSKKASRLKLKQNIA